MRFCQSFMSELYRHIGPNTDVPAGDIGVGGREIGYLFGQYKRLKNEFSGVLTGKGSDIWWIFEYVLKLLDMDFVTFTQALLKDNGTSFEGKTVAISGSGNVAIYACEKATQLGAKVVTMSDSNGFIYDPDGIDLDLLKRSKKFVAVVLKNMPTHIPDATYTPGARPWSIPCDIALTMCYTK